MLGTDHHGLPWEVSSQFAGTAIAVSLSTKGTIERFRGAASLAFAKLMVGMKKALLTHFCTALRRLVTAVPLIPRSLVSSNSSHIDVSNVFC